MKKSISVIFIFSFFILAVQCSKEERIPIDKSLIPTSVDFKLSRVDHILFTGDNGLLIAGIDGLKSTIIKTNYKFETEWTKSDYEWGTMIPGSGWGSNFYGVNIVKMFQRSDGCFVCVGAAMEGGCVVYQSTLIIVLNHHGEQLRKYEFKDIGTSNALRTNDGGYLLFGNKLIKLDQNFNLLWEKNLWDSTFFHDQLILTANGGIATTGTFNSEQAFLKKYDFRGNEISTTTYKHNASPFNELGTDLVQLKDNGFLIIGRTRNLNQIHDMDYQIIRTNFAGDTLWTKRFGSSKDEWLDRIISSDENKFVVQGSGGVNYQYNPVLFRINSDGQILNSKEMERFIMLVYSPLKFYLKVKSLDANQVNFTRIEPDDLFN